MGIQGNEKADEEAKKAAREGSSAQNLLPAPLRKMLPRSKAAAWQVLWTSPIFFSFFLFAFDSTPLDSIIILSHFTPSSSDHLYVIFLSYVPYT